MKKLAIAGASAVLAAMPVVGVFAATEVSTTDTLTVTVPTGCTVNDTARTTKTAAFGPVAPGDNGTAQSTSAMSISCNAAWSVTPMSEGLKATDKTTITSPENAKGSWFKVQLVAGNTEGINGGTINNPFSTANTINGTNKVTGDGAAQDLTLTPTYTLHIGNNQEQGSYTGDVTYTIAIGA